jgi:ABC-type amino acid transport substrate-binding protein
MKTFKHLLGALVAVASLASPAIAQDAGPAPALTFKDYPKPWPFRSLVKAGTLTVAVTTDIPPASFIDPGTGKIDGYMNKLWEKIGDDLGLKVDLVAVDWASTLPGLASNRFDTGCAGAAWTQQRLTSPDFLLTSPIQVTAAVGLTLKSSGIKTWADTQGKRLGGVRGEVYYEDGTKKLKGLAGQTEFPGPQEGLLALLNSQVDFLMMNLVQATYFIQQSPQKDSLSIIAEPLKVYPESLCVNGRESDLLTAINILLGNYRADGSYKKIVQQYSKNTDMLDPLPALGY